MMQANLPTTPLPNEFSEDDDSVEAAQQHYKNTSVAEYMEALLEDQVPKEFKKSELFEELWSYMNKNIKLSFMEQDDIDLIESYFEDAKFNFMMARPANSFSFEEQQQMEAIRMNLRVSLKRAKGTTESNFNERKAQISQFQQHVNSNTETLQHGGSGSGVFSKMKRFF